MNEPASENIDGGDQGAQTPKTGKLARSLIKKTIIVATLISLTLFVFYLIGYYKEFKGDDKQRINQNAAVEEQTSVEDKAEENSEDQGLFTGEFVDINVLDQYINDGEIYLTKKGDLYVFDTYSKDIKSYEIGSFEYFSDLNFTEDGSYLIANADKNIIVYHFPTGNYAAIDASVEKVGPSPRVEKGNVSPANNYFLLTTSCCPGDSGRAIYDFNGNLIKQLVGGTTLWSPDGTKFAMSKGDIELNMLPLGPPPALSSIYLEDLSSSYKESLLVEAEPDSSYSPVEWLDDQNLIYRKDEYSEPFIFDTDIVYYNDSERIDELMEVYENPTRSYWKINIETGEEEPIPDYEWKGDRGSYSPQRTWKIVTEVENSSFVKHLTNSEETMMFRFSSEVRDAVWRP